jgi:hypothetical protein
MLNKDSSIPDTQKITIRQRLLSVLQGRKPDHIPLISRLDFWYNGLKYQKKLPEKYQDLSLEEIHAQICFGQEEWYFLYRLRLLGAELTLTCEGEEIYHQTNPEVTNFPSLWGMVPSDRPGTTEIEIKTPVGTLFSQQKLLVESLESGAWRPLTTIHPIRNENDFIVCEYLLEHSEFVPAFSGYQKREKKIGENGFLVPMLNRTPFQCLLLDGLGEMNLFYALHDNPIRVERIFRLMDEVNRNILENLAEFNIPYVEFCENLDVSMANPKLFLKYLLPVYQSYAEILHHQGKLLGAHLDGNLNGLEYLLAESELDVCESFTPAPMTACIFENAWNAWRKGPLIWGGIPSHFLESSTEENIFHQQVYKLLALIGSSPIILGIADAVMPDNQIDRLIWLVQIIEGEKY